MTDTTNKSNELFDISLQNTIQVFQACRPTFIKNYLERVGLARHELTAELELVPESIRKAIPNTWGFGLSGGYGVGKTFCIAALIRRMATNVVTSRMTQLIKQEDSYELNSCGTNKHLSIIPWPLWCNWPAEIATRRAQLYRNQGGEVEEWIQSLRDPNHLLILDDIGAERTTGQDWAGEVLARIIDERLRSQGQTVWTSNLNAKEIAERYGARTFSRIQALSPIIRVPALPDLRLQSSIEKTVRGSR